MKKMMKLNIPVWLCVGMACGFVTTEVIAHEWMAPKTAAKQANPVPYEQDSIGRGKEVYLDNCVACHGDRAQGMNAEEAGLKKDAPNLKKRLSTHTDGDFYWKIQEGRGEMPSFKEELSPKEIWEVIHFIKSSPE